MWNIICVSAMQAASTTLQFFAKAITVGAVFIHVVAVSVSSMSRSPEPYQLIFETHVSKTELAGSIALRCRDGDTAQELDISEISFFLNRSSVADPSLRERGDIPVVEVDRHTIEFNLTHRLEGYYTCGRRVNATHVRESLPKTFVCKSKVRVQYCSIGRILPQVSS